MNCESKQPNTPSKDDEQEVTDWLRNELRRCPDIDPNGAAMQVALGALEKVQEIINVKVQLKMKSKDEHTMSREAVLPPFTTSAATNDILRSTAAATTTVSAKQKTDVNTLRNDNYAPSQLGSDSCRNYNQLSKQDEKKVDSPKAASSIVLKILRTLTIDLPLLSLFLLTCTTYSLSHVYDHYLGPQIEHMKYTEDNRAKDISYYHRVCPLGAMSTTKVEDLLIEDDFTTDDCVEHMMVHGKTTKNRWEYHLVQDIQFFAHPNAFIFSLYYL